MIAGVFSTGGVGLGWYGSGVMGVTHVVGVVVDVRIEVPVPAGTVDVVVVGIVVDGGSGSADEVVVGGHDPGEGGTQVGGAEAEILCRTIDFAVLYEIDAFEVDGHEDFFAGIGIVAVQPYFVER